MLNRRGFLIRGLQAIAGAALAGVRRCWPAAAVPFEPERVAACCGPRDGDILVWNGERLQWEALKQPSDTGQTPDVLDFEVESVPGWTGSEPCWLLPDYDAPDDEP